MYQVNRRLPAIEKFELGSQIRRAAVSLTNNIAEGHGRFHYLEQIKFCLNARGSLEELLHDLNVCEDESYLPVVEIDPLKQRGWRVHQVLNGYMRWLRAQKQGAALELRENSPAYGLTVDQLDELLEDQEMQTALTNHASRFNASANDENSNFQNLARRRERREVRGLCHGNFRRHGRARCRPQDSGDAGQRPRLPLELQGRQVRLLLGGNQRHPAGSCA